MKLSVVLATKNEAANIQACLASIVSIADEVIVVDEYSSDQTRSIARGMGAKVFKNKHKINFHESKQMAIDKARGDWVLLLDADERVSGKLGREIKKVIQMSDREILSRWPKGGQKWKLFQRHQKIVKKNNPDVFRDKGEVAAFFVPRRNYFVGSPLTYAGVYPDAVIRLFKKGRAYLPAKSVHEQMVVNGAIAWLFNDLEHHESPTLGRYLLRLNRYTDEHSKTLENRYVPKNAANLLKYSFVKPFWVFILMYLRHKGYKDGTRGFVWCTFSAFHYPLAYWKFWTKKN